MLCCLVSGLPAVAQESRPQTPPEAAQADPFALDVEASEAGKPDLSEPAAGPKALRTTLSHEASARPRGERGLVNNRSWLRLEYSKFFLDSFYVQLDSKLNVFWPDDHRARAADKRVAAESMTPEAFLQYSAAGGSTSLKVGVQRLIWGESEAGAITDEVSPRNYSELFFIPLEESRIGQFMLNLDHFSESGNWSAFYVPRPKFNKTPRPGTAYYVAPFGGSADIRDATTEGREHEYGMRWKKTFGKSDISFMAASLINNDYVYRLDGVDAAGRMAVSRVKERFTLTGMTFNYAFGHYLLKGEVGLKSPKRFNDSSFGTVEKKVIDSSLGLSYSLGDSDTIGLELVNSHVREWQDSIASAPRNTPSLVLNTNLFFLNDTLSVNWLTIYNRPYTSYQSSLRTAYKWTDNTTLSLDAHLIDVPSQRSGLRAQRDQDQIVLRIQYQF
jgi:hypothetical protein